MRVAAISTCQRRRRIAYSGPRGERAGTGYPTRAVSSPILAPVEASLSKKIGILRFVAVATVVVYHAYPPGWPGGYTEALVSLGLARWALPFLGLISGYLFFRTFTPTLAGYAGKLRSRLRTILVPFLIWSANRAAGRLADGQPRVPGPHHLTGRRPLPPGWSRPCASPLWFLQALMTCIVLSPLVYLAVRALRAWVLVVAVVWWVTGFQPEVLDPWVSPVAFPPFVAGAAVAMLKPRLDWARRPAPAWALAALAGGWLAAAALFAGFGPALGQLARAAMLPVVVLGALTVWLGYEALRRPLRRAPGVVAAAVYVAPLSFFVYATQQPQLKADPARAGRVRDGPSGAGGLRARAAARHLLLAAAGDGLAPRLAAHVHRGVRRPRRPTGRRTAAGHAAGPGRRDSRARGPGCAAAGGGRPRGRAGLTSPA